MKSTEVQTLPMPAPCAQLACGIITEWLRPRSGCQLFWIIRRMRCRTYLSKETWPYTLIYVRLSILKYIVC